MRNVVVSAGFMLLLLRLFAWFGGIGASVKARRAWERLPGMTSAGTGVGYDNRFLAPVRFAVRHKSTCLCLVAGIVALALTRMVVVAICTALLASIALHMKRKRAVRRHRRLLLEQVPELLEALVQPLRAGLSLSSALESAADELPEPFAAEARKAVNDIHLGVPLETALDELSDRCGSPDLRLASSALVQQRAAGGNLPQLLEALKSVMRDRATLTREVRVLTAQGRLSGYLVASLPAAFLAIECLFSRSAVQALFTQPMGWAILGVGLGLEILGLLIIRRICNLSEEA